MSDARVNFTEERRTSMGIGANIKRWSHGKQYAVQIFNPSPGLAQLAVEALEWCLLDRGIELNEEIVEEVRRETDKYPKLTVREFVESQYNKNMNESLRKW